MTLREKLCIWLFDISKKPYASIFKYKNEPWEITKKDLLNYPYGTLGYHMGHFLDTNNFEMIAKLERHDAFHVITGISTSVEDEIALQYFFFGNGKKSFYMTGVILIGTVLLPEFFSKYTKAYRLGLHAKPIYKLNVEDSLLTQLQSIKSLFSIQY